jgi:cell division protein FtsQ
MLQQIDKKQKLFIYLFFLLLLTTFNNLSLSNSEYLKLKINQIKVSGLNSENNFKISEEFNKLVYQKNIFFISKDHFINILEKNNLIHSFKVTKIYPNFIEVQINKKFFIGSNGKLINFESYNKSLPYVFGKIKIKDFIKFKKIIAKSKFNFEEISELYFFPSGRWDIKNNKGILIKLPETNLLKALNLAYHITINEIFKNDKVIDLRIYNHVISTNE